MTGGECPFGSDGGCILDDSGAVVDTCYEPFGVLGGGGEAGTVGAAGLTKPVKMVASHIFQTLTMRRSHKL